MKTQHILITIVLFVAASVVGFAQTRSFDKEIAPWHKKATMQCGMLKADPVNAAQILKNVSELQSELQVLSGKYLENPPAEYANDPNWKSYFMTFAENLVVVKERVERKQFVQASLYCPNFCMTFGKMHKINGTTDLTDLVFAWRMEIKNTSDMLNTGNTAGANQNVSMVEGIYQKLTAMKSSRNDNSLNELFKPIDAAYTAWLKATKGADKPGMNVALNNFMDGFAKPYLATF
jgi:hypothetical protein